MLAFRHRRLRAPQKAREGRSQERSRGQSLVEFALVLIPLMMIFTGILQFAVLFSAQVGVTNGVREAVREASAIPVANSADAATAANRIYTILTDSTSGLLKRNGSSYSSGALVTTGIPRTRVCYYSYTDPSGSTSVMARVDVQYKHPLFIPLISGIIDGFDGANDGAYQLGSSAEIRVANPPLASAGGIGGSGSPTCNA